VLPAALGVLAIHRCVGLESRVGLAANKPVVALA
jgi:hypothetical protein